MSRTLVPTEQLNFRSANSGTHLLDTYLEDAEMGGLTLAVLLNKLFNESTGEVDAFTFTYDNTSGAEKMSLQIGGGTTSEIASFTQLFVDLNSFKTTAIADMEVKRVAAALSETNASTSATNAATSEGNASTAKTAAEAARDLAQTYANQAFATTPAIIGQNIVIAQLFGDLFDGSTLSA